MFKKLKKANGITLIALIVSIIILLILAGVAISVTVGENGVLTQATTAVKKNKKAKVLEDVKLAWTGIKADYYAKWAQNSGVQFSQIVNKIVLQKYLEGTVNSLEKTGEREYTLDYTENDKEESRYIILLDEEGNVEFSEGLIIPETLALEIVNGEEITKESKTIKAILMNLEEPVNWSVKEGAEKISLSSTKGEEITVTAEAGGEATIQATCGNHTKTCTVTVNVVTPIRSIDSISGETTINLNDEFPQTILTANVIPEGATENNLIWESLNEDIAEVTNVNGRIATITGKTVGTVTIKVSKRVEESIVYKEVDINVVRGVTGIKLRETGKETDLTSEDTITMAPSGNGTTVTKSFTAIIEPENATNKGIIWEIVNPSSTGVISLGTPVVNENESTVIVSAGENSGSATLRAKSEDGSYTALVKIAVIIVKIRKTGTNIDIGSADMIEVSNNSTISFTAIVEPPNVENNEIIWSIENASPAGVITLPLNIFTTSGSGITVTTGTLDGNATLKATLFEKENIYATCKISVGLTYTIVSQPNISDATTCIGCYASIDGDNIPEGIIYADLGKGNQNRYGLGESYSFSAISNLKTYKISNETVNGTMGKRKLIKLVSNADSTKNKRFYIMGLQNINNKTYYWYKNAYGNMSDYSTTTSIDFGKGARNTENMKTKCKYASYGAVDTEDMWAYVPDGWWVPSKKEWAVFAGELGVNSNNYNSSNFGLVDYYWTSSQINENSAYYTWFSQSSLTSTNVKYNLRPIRVSTTF